MGRFSNDPRRYICANYEQIENYAKTTHSDEKWEIHHRFETHFSNGAKRPANCQLTSAELRALGMYYGRKKRNLPTSIKPN